MRPTDAAVRREKAGLQPSRRVGLAILALLAVPWGLPDTAFGQFGGRFELSASISLNEVDGAIQTHLQRVRAFQADGQWGEAVETLRRLMESSGDRLIEFQDRRYITLQDYCQAILASLPEEALDLYRNQVDPQARKWYEAGIAQRDESLLKKVVEQSLVSKWGDDALLALGEISLEQGRPSEARAWWEKLIEYPPALVPGDVFQKVRGSLADESIDAQLIDQWYEAVETANGMVYYFRRSELHGLTLADSTALIRFWRRVQLPPWQLTFPDTDIPRADIQSRLVLASVLEGSPRRAESGIAELDRLFPDAAGRLAGRKGPYAKTLQDFLESSRKWPAAPSPAGWTTFAGSPSRNTVPSYDIDVGTVRWRMPLENVTVADNSVALNLPIRQRRVAEDNNVLLSHHPVVSGNRVFYKGQHQIFGVDLQSGKPLWPSIPGRPEGEIYANKIELEMHSRVRFAPLGVERHTLTVHGDRLFARMGSPVTGTMAEPSTRSSSGYVVCLDLAKQGRLLWNISADDEKWAFEGTPLCDGSRAYIAMRRSDVRPQAHVACLDVETGRMLWRRFISSAETPAHGMADECTHNLLTMHHDTLFINTNLGAVAALDAADGRVKWLYAYHRVESGDLNRPGGHMYRDLTPCLYDRGRLFVAPADSERIICLDAQTGAFYWDKLLWARGQYHPEDAIHLLGVANGYLVASGDRLWRIHVESGKLQNYWPEGPTPRGYGRGLLVDDKIYWPTREQIFVLSQTTGVQVQQPINLSQRNVYGGNLIATENCLLIASIFPRQDERPPQSELVALDRFSQIAPMEEIPNPQAVVPGERLNLVED
ncbi:MAG: PQQ-binding-like beta-propeller repeat protein [Pirellulales bacterium]